jgi:hypothetical protein
MDKNKLKTEVLMDANKAPSKMDRNPVSSSKVRDFLWIWFIKMSKKPIAKIKVLIASEPKFASNKPDAKDPVNPNSVR